MGLITHSRGGWKTKITVLVRLGSSQSPVPLREDGVEGEPLWWVELRFWEVTVWDQNLPESVLFVCLFLSVTKLTAAFFLFHRMKGGEGENDRDLYYHSMIMKCPLCRCSHVVGSLGLKARSSSMVACAFYQMNHLLVRECVLAVVEISLDSRTFFLKVFKECMNLTILSSYPVAGNVERIHNIMCLNPHYGSLR